MEDNIINTSIEDRIKQLEADNIKLEKELQKDVDIQSDLMIKNIELSKENEELKIENEKLLAQINSTEQTAIELVDIVCKITEED